MVVFPHGLVALLQEYWILSERGVFSVPCLFVVFEATLTAVVLALARAGSIRPGQ